MFADEDLVPISALPQYIYCPRRAALLLVERQWADNIFTIEGRHVHEKAHKLGRKERIPGGYRVRGLHLKSERLGLVGVCDVVEFFESDCGGPRVLVIEYKRGRRKRFGQLEYCVQLCAQVICLEEMLNVHIPQGALFFAKSKHRFDVLCTPELRLLVEQTTQQVRHLLQTMETPTAVFTRKCDGCSMVDICMPRVVSHPNVQAYLKRMIDEGK